MSPSFASSATKAGSFFSSSLWKRVFSRQRMSPSFIPATAFWATSPMQSSANATDLPITSARAAATGFSDSLGSRPLGRPKCASRMTLPPLPEISVMVGAIRSSRVASVTRPFSVGTLRSTRSKTRLPFTSTSSRVRNALVIDGLLSRALRNAELCAAEPGPMLMLGPGSAAQREERCTASGTRDSEQLPHRHRGVGHAVGETPFIVVPGHHPHERAVLHLGLVHVERGGMRIVVEVDRDVGRGGIAEDALELLLAGALHPLVDFFLGGLALRDDLEIDHRNVRGGDADRDAVEFAGEFRHHEADRLGRTGRGRDHRHRGGPAAIEVAVQGV